MNVDLVQASTAGIERQTLAKTARVATPGAPSPAPGTVPRKETSKPADDTSGLTLFPEHEVKVQLDTLADDTLVYEIVDKQSGSLVLQVPSAGEVRGIQQAQQELLRAAWRVKPAHSATGGSGAVTRSPAREGEENNGRNKL